MKSGKSGKGLENLLFSGLVMLIGLSIVILQQLLSGITSARERDYLVASMSAKSPILVSRLINSTPARIYRWGGTASRQFGALLPVGGPGYSALIGIGLSREGRINALSFASASGSASLIRDESILASFIGKDTQSLLRGGLEGHLVPGAEGREAIFVRDFLRSLGEIEGELGRLEVGGNR